MCEIGWWLKIAKIGISVFINSFNEHLKFLTEKQHFVTLSPVSAP